MSDVTRRGIEDRASSAGRRRAAAAPTVGETGERGVLARVLRQLSPSSHASIGPGDDCAVMAVDGDLVVTSDTMIEGTDFRLDWHTGFELGWKLAATNLSDVAAMGATPTGLTVSLACPRDTPVALLEEVAAGLDAACRELAPGCAVVGGDLASAPTFFAAVTALGHLSGRAPITRDAARSHDLVAYAGQLGLSGLGLRLLQAGEHRPEDLRGMHPVALGAHLAPTPPVDLGAKASRAGATSMLDVSDSLSLDAYRIAEASGVTLNLDSSALVREFGTQSGERVPLEVMLSGGEDHGLLATFPDAAVLPAGFVTVGTVTRDDGAGLTLDDAPYTPHGWDTFAGG